MINLNPLIETKVPLEQLFISISMHLVSLFFFLFSFLIKKEEEERKRGYINDKKILEHPFGRNDGSSSSSTNFFLIITWLKP